MNEENKNSSALEARGGNKATAKAAKPKKKKPKLKAVIAVVVVLALLGTGAVVVLPRLTNKGAAAVNLTQTTVTRGDISKTITGSGAVMPAEEYTVVPTVSGKILTDNITQGQTINKGDLLYTIDATNAENAIKQDENALERAQLTYEQSKQTLAALKVTSDVSGVITKVYVKNGDQVNANAPIMDIQDEKGLTVTLPFFVADVANMYVGESAVVTVSQGPTASGTVTRIFTGQQYGATGGAVSNVEITLSNPGTVRSGDTAYATVGGAYWSNASGTISYVTSTTVTAKTSGQVTGLTLMAGDAVTAGQTVATLTSDSADSALKSAELQVQNAELTLQNAKDALANYSITSPISGTVIEKDAKAGDTIAASGSGTTMAVIADMSSLVMTIDVDELDILSIKVGQTADITADAIPGKTFTGQVTSVSNVGSSSGSSSGSGGSGSSGTGVTTYAVEITISDYGSLLPGMNVNASIVIDSAKDVLLIPEQAVMTGGFVLKKSDGTADPSASPAESANAQAGGAGNLGMANRWKQLKSGIPAGYEPVQVQIGLTNGTVAEVTGGLSEGDDIAYITPSTTSAASSNTGKSGLGLLGGGTGRMATGAGGGSYPGGGGNFQGGGGFNGGSAGGSSFQVKG